MTYGYKSNTFTAFSLDSLQDAGVNGSFGRGDSFVFDGTADTEITVRDNDKRLSKESWWGGSRDKSGQQASIETDGDEAGTGGKVFVEKIWILRGDDGERYKVAEIGQTGTHESTFTFIGDVPPAGVELTVLKAKHAKNLKYDDLGAGELGDDDDAPSNDPVKLTFEGLAAGTVLSDQFPGVTISSGSSGNPPMIFDSSNPTGHDWDLWSCKWGNILIISEDGDSSDPDDNRDGGTLAFDFENGADVENIRMIDTEEGGVIRAYDADGNLIKMVHIPYVCDGRSKIVEIDAEGVARLEIQLFGSGALDDLCYTPLDPVNAGPDAVDDSGMGCANETITVDVLDNDTDANGDALEVTAVNGTAITEGETITVSGVDVTLTGGELVFDGESAFASLDIGQSSTETFTYTVSDGTDTATADVDVTFCGVAETLQEIYDSLPSEITYTLVETDADPDNTLSYDLRIESTDTNDSRFDGTVFEQAVCISLFRPADASTSSFDDANVLTGDLLGLGEVPTTLFGALQFSAFNGQTAAENLDLISYILNEEYTENGIGGMSATAEDVQAAVWQLTDFVPTSAGDPDFVDSAVVDAILLDAATFGEGFEAGQDDLVTFVIDPGMDNPENTQPFLVAGTFADYDCIC